MAYNSLISRTNAQSLVPEQVSKEIWKKVYETSMALKLFKRSQPLANNQLRIPVMSVLPTAYFITGDTGLKQTTNVAWKNVFLNVEELAVIVPIPIAVLDDTAYDIWAEVQPAVIEAIGVAIDAAIFFGTNIPGSWPGAIVPTAVTAANVIVEPVADQAHGGLAQDISDLFGKVEADGYSVTGAVAPITFKSKLRSVRSTVGERLGADISYGLNGEYMAEGVHVDFGMTGAWPAATVAELVVGDFSQGLIGIRRDIDMTIGTEAVIQDGSGVIQYNLFQQDMVAARFTIRLGFAVPNPINRAQATEANRYPFGVMHT